MAQTLSAGLKRVSSFKRGGGSRRNSAADASDADGQAPTGGFVQKLVRSNSFTRRRNSASERPATGGNSENSSEPSSPRPEEMALANVPLAALHGWLKKRHCKDKTLSNQWARRYFSVDDARGTLSYSKGEAKKPSVVLPLVDISSVKEASDIVGYGFVISCPPVHLTVCADDREDRHVWITGLRRRIGLWKDKQQTNGLTFATVGAPEDAAAVPKPMLPRDSYVAQYPRGAGNAGAARGSTGRASGMPAMVPRTLDDQRATAAADRNWIKGGGDDRDDRDDDDAGSDHASGRRSPGEHQYYGVRGAEREQQPARPAPRPAAPVEPEMSAVHTMEIDSGDDDDDDDMAPAAAATWEPPPVSVPPARDLADMLSSDEDEDDDLPRLADVRSGSCAPALCAAPAPRDEPLPLPSADSSSAAASSPSPPVGRSAHPAEESAAPSLPNGGAAPMSSWLSALPDSVYGGADGVAGTPPRAAKAEAGDLALSSSSASSPGGASFSRKDSEAAAPLRPPSPPQSVAVGAGIAADGNAEWDDWDDEEEE